MDIRNIQKTGNMFYVYLPTAWCKKLGINQHSKVGLEVDNNNNLNVSPRLTQKKAKHLEFKIDETDLEVINRLIVSCYLNPLGSFKIKLSKNIDYTKLLDQKRLISLELVEFSEDSITCDASVSISDPLALLTTMARKIRNMIVVMIKKPNKDLIEKYEEEIDRNNILIEKSVLAAFANLSHTSIKTSDLHFMSIISRSLERMVDWLIIIDKPQKNFLNSLESTLKKLSEIIDNINKKQVNINLAIDLIKQANYLEEKEREEERIKRNMLTISEAVMDWMISKQIE